MLIFPTILLVFPWTWSTTKILLDELDPSICRNLESRVWLPLHHDLIPPPVALIKEFYSNLSIQSDSSGGYILISWIWGEEFKITKQIVSEVLGVPLVCRPTYPYSESPLIDDVMTLLCRRFVTWGTEQRLNSYKLIEYN